MRGHRLINYLHLAEMQIDDNISHTYIHHNHFALKKMGTITHTNLKMLFVLRCNEMILYSTQVINNFRLCVTHRTIKYYS